MAIQMRRGQKADFDPTKMLPGEWAVSIDSDTTKQWVWMCFAPGVVKRMAAFEDIEWVLSDEFAKSSVICDVELDSTATKAYAVGDYLMLHGHLYEVTVAITTGDTIEEDVNVTETKVMDTIAGKVDKEAGKGLSTNDYTTAEKNKLAGIEAGAQANTVTGVKGDSEAEYRTGNINITPANIGLGNVDNTSDLDKPVSTAAQTALDGKVDKVSGKQLSTEDYTTAEKTKLNALPDAATLNADLANKQDASTAVRSVNGNLPTNGEVTLNAEDIPADGIGDKSVTGNPLTIEDGMASVAKELSVTLEPIQDLHGYESPWIGTDTDKAPYLFRAVSDSSVQDKGTHELDKLVGGTVAWNQALPAFEQGNWNPESGVTVTFSDGVATFSSSITNNGITCGTRTVFLNHKYFVRFEAKGQANKTVRFYTGGGRLTSDLLFTADDTWAEKSVVLNQGTDGTGNTFFFGKTAYDNISVRNAMFIDLTQMFGSTIADYIYSLEQSTAGAGVAWFRNLFPTPYYPFNSGTLMSVKTSAHVMRGFNQWDEEWEVGGIDAISGVNTEQSNTIRSKNYTPCFPETNYYIKWPWIGNVRARFYDADKNYIGYFNKNGAQVNGNEAFTTPLNCRFMRFQTPDNSGATYNNDICINISKPTGTPKNGDYVAYDAHTYALDSDLELRGIPKLENNALVYDGDVYEASGNVQRKYGIVDLGTLNWFAGTYAGVTMFNTAFTTHSRRGDDPEICVCSKYEVSDDIWSAGTLRDKLISTNYAGTVIYVYDSAYTDSASFKSAMSGVYLVYELATPTTETADPYTSTQVIDTSGTEEYVDTRTVPIPVGHESNYANVCPIEGRMGTEVQRTGKNLLPLTVAGIKAVNSGYTWNGNSTTANGVTFTIQTDANGRVSGILVNGTATSNTDLSLWRGDPNVYSGHIINGGITYDKWVAIEQQNGQVRYISSGADTLVGDNFVQNVGVVYIRIRNEEVCNNDVLYPMIRRASDADPTFEPYSTPDTASVTFGQTVYGGQVDFVSGKCRVTKGNVILTGNEGITWNPYRTTTLIGYDVLPKVLKTSSLIIGFCSHVRTNTVDGSIDSNYIQKTSAGSNHLQVNDVLAYWGLTEQTSEAMNAKLAEWYAVGTPLQIVYELDTPIELTLTPAQLSLLEGTNILTADGQINLTYLGSMASDVQAEIDEFENGLNNVIGSIAFIENQTAKTSHAVGEYIILNGIFCKVIAAISAGEMLSFGTNIQATTIGAELKAIWAEISA